MDLVSVAVAPGHMPLVVTAIVPHGLISGHPWGIALDGLLAAQVHAERKTAARERGLELPRLAELEVPEDLALPLSRCSGDGGEDWHWAATCSWPVDGHELMPDVRTLTGFVDERSHDQLAESAPAVVSLARGRYRHRFLPLMATVCSAVTWHAVGDPTAILGLLAPVAGIGKRRAGGEGRVLQWTVTPTDADPWDAAHLHPDGTLGRPCPATCLTGAGEPRGAGLCSAGLRPPYMHPARQRVLHVPAPVGA